MLKSQRYHEKQKLIIQEIAHHRNGVSGVPFYVIKFRDETPDEPWHEMVGVIFDRDEYEQARKKGDWPNPYCAVLDTDMLTNGIVTFGPNSFRGDAYVDALCGAIKKWEKAENRKFKRQVKKWEAERAIERKQEGSRDLRG